MRLRRAQGSPAVAVRGLTPGQQAELLHGFAFDGAGFASPAEYQLAWRRHRDALMEALGPFRRPDAYWAEVGFIPCCAVNGYENEKAALLRLGLPLTALEEQILAARKLQTHAN